MCKLHKIRKTADGAGRKLHPLALPSAPAAGSYSARSASMDRPGWRGGRVARPHAALSARRTRQGRAEDGARRGFLFRPQRFHGIDLGGAAGGEPGGTPPSAAAAPGRAVLKMAPTAGPYSARSASMGSTWVARQAGDVDPSISWIFVRCYSDAAGWVEPRRELIRSSMGALVTAFLSSGRLVQCSSIA